VRVRVCDDAKQIVFGTLDNAPVNDASGKLRVGTETGDQLFADSGAPQNLGILTLLYFS